MSLKRVNSPMTFDGTSFKIFTAEATLDFPSISSNATESLTMTVAGASTGDSVAIGAPAGIEAGLVWSAVVTAADTVTIRVQNDTGGSINPASATWRATVFEYEP